MSEHDDVVEVGGNAFKVLNYLVYHVDEPPGRGTAALGHDESFREPGGCAERRKGGGVLVNSYLGEQRHAIKQREDEKIRPFPENRGPHPNMRSYPKGMIASSFFVVDGN